MIKDRTMKEKISPRERVLLALNHQYTDRIPIAMVCSGINPPAYKNFEIYIKKNKGITAEEYIENIIDIKGISPDYKGPALEKNEDIWGVKRKAVCYGEGFYDEIYYYPLAGVKDASELKNYRWPDLEWFDYSSLPEKISELKKGKDYAILVGNGNIFETSWYMRGFEQILMDFVLNPDIANEIMKKVTDFYTEYFKKILEVAGNSIDLIFTADDIAGQRGLLMSLEMWEKFIKPYHIKLNRMIHNFGVKVIYHSDGNVMDAVGGLIDMGIGVLQPLQFSAEGMDPYVLKDRYGHILCFEGGVSVQKVLPFGTREEVREEVESLIKILGKNGGYILGPDHAIQAGTPPENIFEMFETALSFYPF